MSKLNELVEWLCRERHEYVLAGDTIRAIVVISILTKARSLLAEEAAEKKADEAHAKELEESMTAAIKERMAEEAAQKPTENTGLISSLRELLNKLDDSLMDKFQCLSAIGIWGENTLPHYKPKPTAPASLANSVREFYGWLKIRRIDLQEKVVSDNDPSLKIKKDMLDEVIGAAYRISPNYHTPTESIAEEPLPVLADNEGYWVNANSNGYIWHIYLGAKGGMGKKEEPWFEAKTYAAAEAKARQFLESLSDRKEEKK